VSSVDKAGPDGGGPSSIFTDQQAATPAASSFSPSVSFWCDPWLKHLPRPGISSRGFSLVELLVVIAVISILATLSIGGLNNVARSSKLANAAQRVGDQIALARQLAVSRNLPVEVRFYKLPDFDATTGGPTLWRGMQLFMSDGTATNAASRPVFFPQRVIISSNSAISPLLVTAMGAEITPTNNVGAYSTSNVQYKSFTIRPNGMLATSNSLVDANNFLTLHQQNDPMGTDGVKPANFITVQVNPITSKVTIQRP